MKYDAMISYRRGNKAIREKIAADLEREGIKTWVDVNDIEKAVSNWWEPIEEGIREASCVVALLSPKYLASAVCALEIETAFNYGKPIITVVVEDLDKVSPAGRKAGKEKHWADLIELKERFRAFEEKESEIEPETNFTYSSVQALLKLYNYNHIFAYSQGLQWFEARYRKEGRQDYANGMGELILTIDKICNLSLSAAARHRQEKSAYREKEAQAAAARVGSTSSILRAKEEERRKTELQLAEKRRNEQAEALKHEAKEREKQRQLELRKQQSRYLYIFMFSMLVACGLCYAGLSSFFAQWQTSQSIIEATAQVERATQNAIQALTPDVIDEISNQANALIGQMFPTATNTPSRATLTAQAALVSPSPIPSATATTCPNNIRPRLEVGGEGRVLAGLSNNVRISAGTRSRLLGQIEPRRTFEVIDGPICADGYTWWKVSSAGLVGWTAEGDSSYFLEPISN